MGYQRGKSSVIFACFLSHPEPHQPRTVNMQILLRGSVLRAFMNYHSFIRPFAAEGHPVFFSFFSPLFYLCSCSSDQMRPSASVDVSIGNKNVKLILSCVVILFRITVGTAIACRCAMPDGHCLNSLLSRRRSTAALVFRVGACLEVSLFYPPPPPSFSHSSPSLIGLLASVDVKQQSKLSCGSSFFHFR